MGATCTPAESNTSDACLALESNVYTNSVLPDVSEDNTFISVAIVLRGLKTFGLQIST